MRKKAKPQNSIRGVLKRTYGVISVVVFIPTLILFVIALGMPIQYNKLIGNAEDAILLRENACAVLKNEIWEIVAGRKAFGDGRQYEILLENDRQLSSLNSYNPQTTQYLAAAVHANSTLKTYIDTLGDQTVANMAVSYQKAVYNEIIGVTNLMDEVLQLYINECTTAITAFNRTIFGFTLLMLTLVAVIVIFVLLFLRWSFVRVNDAIRGPIIELEDMANQIAGGNLEASVSSAGTRELEQLVQNLNTMAYQIRRYIDKEVETQNNLKKAEMRALQEQIKPHFIYNTFDTIIWLAEENENRQVVDITMAFTDYLRLALNNGNDYTTVEVETQHVRSYLAIQSVRYSNKMSYEIDVDPAIYPHRILKLLLQPLVENSIYHGIKQKHTRGSIRIIGRLTDAGTLYFAVEDNGMGMTGQRMAELHEHLDERYAGEDSSVGLLNVNRRIRLYYQGQGITVESKHGVGTRVSFELPVEA